MFTRIFAAYEACPDSVKDVVKTMVHVIGDPSTTAEERDDAIDTLMDALFPAEHDGEYGLDAESMQAEDEAAGTGKAMNEQEMSFSQKVRKLLKSRKMTQNVLADSIGVGQSAVAMILSRRCRPQRATVEKIAKALQVDAKYIWPERK